MNSAPVPAGTSSLLQPLQELPLPTPASYAPQTAGWALVGVVLIVAALLIVWFGWRRYRSRRYRRAALAELAVIEAALADASQRAVALAAIPSLIKRTSLAAAPRERVAALTGDAWLSFLHSTHGHFDDHSGALLALIAYAPPERVAAVSQREAETLLRQARDWIEHHHVEI